MRKKIEMVNTRYELVKIEVENVKAETEKGILCVVEGKEHWIPKSQVDDDSEVAGMGDSGVMLIPRWLAEDKGFVD